MRRYHELLTLKVVPYYLRRSLQPVFLEHLLSFRDMIVLKDLLVCKRTTVAVPKSSALVILIESWHYLAYIICAYRSECLGFKVLYKDLWSPLILEIDRNEILEPINFVNDETFTALNKISPFLLLPLAHQLVTQSSQFVIL